jgi:hypothetical protein
MWLLIQKSCTRKVQKKFVINYGAIIDHFGNENPYKKDDA